MLERIGELVRERRVEGIAEVRDEFWTATAPAW